MATFQVENPAERSCRCTPRRALLETDDWLEAEAYVMDHPRPPLSIEGAHPTHKWRATGSPRRCVTCGAWGNGSYGSHAPCGYDFEGLSLFTHVERWRAERLTTTEATQ